MLNASFAQSIFFRIYAGLVLVCALAALTAYVLISTINDKRIERYREDMATGAFYLVAAGVTHQEDDYARQNWLGDASALFDAKFNMQPLNPSDFTADETRRLYEYKSVIRFDEQLNYADVFQKIPDENNILSVKVNNISEQQVKAMGVFLLDDLSYHLSRESERLEELQRLFSYSLDIKKIQQMQLDPDQEARIRRQEIVLLFRDSTSVNDRSITMVVPSKKRDEVIVMGPIPLFNWAPMRLIVGITLLSLLLISLGVYMLLFPLEKKIRQIQSAVTQVRSGKLDAKVKVVGHDEIAHLATTFNSMTEHIKRLIDTQRELTRAVSHELRTPVARIRFAVEMLADTDAKQERYEQVANIDTDIEALDSLIDEILTYAKLEESSPKLDMRLVDLSELIDQVVRETKALGKPLEITAELVSRKVSAMADMRYLHRVVQNLAGNATRYAKNKIIISAGVEKNMAFVSVEDDGDGIAEKDREKIFMPFARLDDSRTRASGGYGLGLSIVSRIAFWFDGNMEVDESPSLGGARFTMYWPVRSVDKPIQTQTSTEE